MHIAELPINKIPEAYLNVFIIPLMVLVFANIRLTSSQDQKEITAQSVP
jgi:hypothetical protein